MDVMLRRLRVDDINQVIDIEREAFSPLWISSPFRRDIKNRYASYLVACSTRGFNESSLQDVLDPPERAPTWRRLVSSLRRQVTGVECKSHPRSVIVGYVSVWYQGDEAHITEIAVREHFRGQGIGELLLIGSLRAAVQFGSEDMTLETRVSNFIAQRLYEKYHFKSVGTRKAYYSDNREDAVIMTVTAIGSNEYRRSFEVLQDTYRSRWGEIYIRL